MAHRGVEVRDLGWRRIHRELKSLHGAATRVGFHKNGGKHDKERVATKGGKTRVTRRKGAEPIPDIATVAAWMIFGTRNKAGKEVIPRRDFMAQTLEKYQHQLNELREKLLDQIYEGKLTAPKALAILGQRFEDMMKRTITTGTYAPNAPATVAAKGSDRPLINTGQMRQSVRHVEDMPRGKAKGSLSDAIGAGLDKLGGALVPGEGGGGE